MASLLLQEIFFFSMAQASFYHKIQHIEQGSYKLRPSQTCYTKRRVLQEIYFLQQKPVLSIKSWILYVIKQYLQPVWSI